uniref:membrane-associated progesterone-binding protein 4 isoform X2 n=1 Tax=Erigeron canadensis TaxID=72917 RepID=UPI001CB95208|nr:membrane-associated progesterone-binding protein 4 isoform X2 [Erigeron canadensis]
MKGISPFVGIAITIALISLLFTFLYPLLYHHHSPSPPTPRLFTVEDLAIYNGTDNSLPIFLGILGDASRAFVSGNFTGDGLTDSLAELSSTEVKSIVEWRDFYNRTYIYVGKLVGRYYNSEGNPTKYLKGVEAKAKRGAQLMEKQKIEEAKVPGCNSRWSQDEGSEVWCDNGYPRLVQRPLEIALTGKMSKRCACYSEIDLDQPGLEVYEGCGFLSKSCRL